MSEYEDRRRSSIEEEERAFRDEYRSDAVDTDYDRPRGTDDYAQPRSAADSDLSSSRMLAAEAHLFDRDVADRLQRRWDEIQTAFVDEPRQAVQEADSLVGEVTDRLHEMFRTSRNELEQQWSTGREASTEDLRQALQRYRAFFHRLLSI